MFLEFLVCQMAQAVQLNQMVLSHPMDQPAQVDQVSRKDHSALASLRVLVAPTVLVVLLSLYLRQALQGH